MVSQVKSKERKIKMLEFVILISIYGTMQLALRKKKSESALETQFEFKKVIIVEVGTMM